MYAWANSYIPHNKLQVILHAIIANHGLYCAEYSLAATPPLSSSLSEQQLKVAIKSSSILLEDVRSVIVYSLF